jgi:hypothetical protein
MIDTSSREYNLTCRANQPHHGNLAQAVGRIRPCSGDRDHRLGAEASVDFLPRGVVYTIACALDQED